MENVILVFVLAAVLGGAVWYVVRTKKRGRRCIGCPDGGCANCSGNCNCNH